MVFCGLFPIDSDDYPGAARRAREADAQRRRAVLGAGDLRRARLRLPLRLPRPAAHGHRARAPGARVRPRAAGDDAVASSSRSRSPTARRSRSTTRPTCPTRRAIAEVREPYIRASILAPEGVHRPDHGALPGAPRRARRHALPVARARAAHLRPAAGRDRARLLRPAEVAHARLRVARLRARSACGRPTWSSSTSCSPATRSTRCRWSCTATRPTRRAATLAEKLRKTIPRQQYDVPIQAAIGAQDHRPRDGQGLPQGRDRQVLRRRHHAASASCSRSRRRARSG